MFHMMKEFYNDMILLVDSLASIAVSLIDIRDIYRNNVMICYCDKCTKDNNGIITYRYCNENGACPKCNEIISLATAKMFASKKGNN